MKRGEELRDLAVRSREAILLAAVVGGITGLVVALFEWVTIELFLDRILTGPYWLWPWMPLIGLTASALVLHLGKTTPSNTDEYIMGFHSHDDMSLQPLLYRIVASVFTLGSGAPGGLEGGSLYIGAGVGTFFQKRFRSVFKSMENHSLMVAGAAAGVAAIFKAPATGAVFALEVPYRDDMGRRLLIPALVGAASGYLAFVAINGTDPLLRIRGSAPFDVRDLIGALFLGVGVGLIVRGYAKSIRMAKSFQKKRPAWQSVLAGGLTIAVLAMVQYSILGGDLALGPGYNALNWATSAERALPAILLVLIIRMAGTVASISGGGVVGLFVPLVVVGGLMGRFVGGAIGAPNLTLFVIIGVAAGLSAGYRVPLAAVMFIAEATGRPGYIVPGLLAAVGADLVMGDSAVTVYQQSGASVNEYH